MMAAGAPFDPDSATSGIELICASRHRKRARDKRDAHSPRGYSLFSADGGVTDTVNSCSRFGNLFTQTAF